VLGHLPVGAGQQHAPVGPLRARGPHLLPVDRPASTRPVLPCTARVCALARSEPEPGSEKNWHHASSPRARVGRNRAFCSSLPWTSSMGPPSSCPSPVGGGSTPAAAYA